MTNGPATQPIHEAGRSSDGSGQDRSGQEGSGVDRFLEYFAALGTGTPLSVLGKLQAYGGDPWVLGSHT
jgi:hypothetical protein